MRFITASIGATLPTTIHDRSGEAAEPRLRATRRHAFIAVVRRVLRTLKASGAGRSDPLATPSRQALDAIGEIHHPSR